MRIDTGGRAASSAHEMSRALTVSRGRPLVFHRKGADVADEEEVCRSRRPAAVASRLPDAHPVSLRIISRTEVDCTVIQVDGQLRDDGVGELERVVAELAGPLRLDLSGLRSADEAGLAALRALRASRATLEGASPFMALLLTPPGDSAEMPEKP